MAAVVRESQDASVEIAASKGVKRAAAGGDAETLDAAKRRALDTAPGGSDVEVLIEAKKRALKQAQEEASNLAAQKKRLLEEEQRAAETAQGEKVEPSGVADTSIVSFLRQQRQGALGRVLDDNVPYLTPAVVAQAAPVYERRVPKAGPSAAAVERARATMAKLVCGTPAPQPASQISGSMWTSWDGGVRFSKTGQMHRVQAPKAPLPPRAPMTPGLQGPPIISKPRTTPQPQTQPHTTPQSSAPGPLGQKTVIRPPRV